MIRKMFLTMLFLILVAPQMACAYAGDASVVDVRIVSDNGGEFAQYRTYPRVRQEGRYFYVEAVKGEKYSIEVTNKSDKQIGVVIAVDGRNIISGSKSDRTPHDKYF
jgi:hypothetical protein